MKLARRIGLLLLALLVGVLATVAVAWYAEVRTPMPQRKQTAVSPWPVPVPEGWPKAPLAAEDGASSVRQRSTWSGRRSAHENYTVTVYQSGWPCRAMRYVELRKRITVYSDEDSTTTNGLILPATWATAGAVKTVPLIPAWPGFAIDAAFYGAAMMLVWSVPGVFRRRRRRARGHCVACGYDRRGLANALSPCPECGRGPGG